MEVSIIGCVPHLSSENSLTPSECYENIALIPVPENDILINSRKLAPNENKSSMVASASTSELKSGNDVPIKLNSVPNEDIIQRPSVKLDERLIFIEKKDTQSDEEITLDMRVYIDDVPSPIPVAAESVSHVNGICSEADVATTSSSALVTATASCSSSSTSDSVSNANDPSSNDSFANDFFISLNEPCTPGSPQKKIRYLFLFRPNINKILVKNKANNSYRCYVCGGIYRQKFSLKRHYLRSHVDFRYISEADVANCKIPVPNYYEEQHSKTESKRSSNGRKKFKKSNNDVFLDNNDSRLMPGLYRCHDCSDVFCNTEMELREHYNEHPDSVKKKFQCHVCDASFFKKQILSRHLAGHGEKIIKSVCKRCNMEFLSKVEYQKHLASHSSGRKCKYCSKVLSTSANRKRHEALHEGIKTFHCSHCDSSFAQRKDLDRHLRKQHSDLCHICSLCNKVFASKDNLTVHMREKHTGSPKNSENSCKSEDSDKPIVSKPTTVPNAKAKVCHVCKRGFHTVYAMLKHKRNTHPFHSRRKRHKKSIKKEQNAKVPNFSEYQKSHMKSPKNVIKDSSKQTKPSGRPAQKSLTKPSGRPGQKSLTKPSGRPAQKSLTKREKELASERSKFEELKFYNSVHQNIAENLTNFVDGGLSQLSLKEYNFNDLQYCSADHFEERGRIPWSQFNFPQGYDVDAALNTKGHEIKRPENTFVESELLYDAIGLTPTHSTITLDNQTENTVSELSEISIPNDCQQFEKLTLEQKKKLIGKDVISVIVCFVCREKFNSHAAFDEHCTNNHPNVECSFVEIEGDKESPPVVPPELCRINISSEGFRFSCNVPPPLSGYPMKCTKCLKTFETVPELHEHLTICGDFANSSSTAVRRKPKPQRHIKRTMKKRMTLKQQQAALSANSVKTPEKSESNNATKTEKLQFYKNGRLQTKSLTIDMNYFNTKPQKPVKSVSKRGRKSYALVSSMYRNATTQPISSSSVKPAPSKRGRKSFALVPSMFRNSNLQASTSRECSDCRTVFDTLQALNDHIKNSCFGQSPKENGRKFKMSKSAASNDENVNSQYVDKAPYCNSFINQQPRSKFVSSCITNLNKLKQHVTTTQNLPNDELTFTPMDLSRNSSDDITLNSNPSCDNQSSAFGSKTALETAMEAVLTFVNNDEFEQTSQSNVFNKHIQTGKNQITATEVSFTKPVGVKKVGRPRKLKKLVVTSTPLLLQKNATTDPVKRSTISKPSRLEEAIQKLTVRSKEKQLQNKSTVSGVSVSESSTMHLPNSHSLDVPSVTFAKSDLISDKEKSDILTEDNIVMKQNNSKATDASKSIDLVSLRCFDYNNVNNLYAKNNVDTDNARIGLADLSDGCKFSKNVDNLAEKDNDSTGNTSNGQTTPVNKVSNASFQTEKITQTNHLNKNDVPVVSEFSVAEQTNKVNQGTSSHGRSSPTLESILQVINQKLHSEEQESSQQVDSAISWLEDDKFEIPPSRTNLNIIVSNSNVELLPADKMTSARSVPDVFAIKDSQPVNLNTVPESAPDLRDETLEQEPTFSENVLNEAVPNSSIIKMSPVLAEETCPSPKKASVISTGATSVGGNTDSYNIPGSKRNSKFAANEKVNSPVRNISTISPKKHNSINPTLGRRGPGRPRKKVIDDGAAITPINTADTTIVASSITDTSTIDASNMENNTSNQIDASLAFSPATNKDSSIAILPEANLESSLHTDQPLDLQPSRPPNTAERDQPDNQVESDSVMPPVSLRNFRTKSKQTQNSNNNNINDSNLNSTVTCIKTSEFGKNLASRMKEKMRSFDSSNTLIRIEDPNISTSAETSDTNSQTSNEDNKLMKIVKKECDAAELTKIHSCPYCMLEFAYLTNFRRHIKKCQTRFERNQKETEPVPGTPSTHLQHLPKKDEVDYSILNLYRHQSRQTQMMKEVENSNQLIQKYECGVCHRIYLNLFGLMQHKTHHKLIAATPSEQNNESGSCSEVTDIDNMLSYGNDLTPDALQEENEANFGDENIHFNPIIENEIPKSDEKSACDTNEAESSDAKNADSELTDDNSVVVPSSNTEDAEYSNIGDSLPDVNEIDKSSDLKDNSVKEQTIGVPEQPIKRKRGRPFGWRKNANTTQENKGNKNTKKNVRIDKTNAVLFKKKVGKLQSMDGKSLVFTKLKANTREVILHKIAKPLLARQKLKLMATEKEECLDSAPFKHSESAVTSSENSLSSPKEILKFLSKRLPVKIMPDIEKALPDSVDVKDATDIFKNTPKVSEKTLIDSRPSEEYESNNSGKRGRGRPPVSPAKVPNKHIIKSESPQKRRPGRPPKNLSSSPSTSQSTKSGYSQTSLIRKLRKGLLPVLSHSDSSDSECEKIQPKTSPRKKMNLKICAICKEKFASNLELHRHIQLVHSRQLPHATNKADSSRALKKSPPKSPTINASENQSNTPTKQGGSPLRKSSNLKVCTICKKQFLTYLLLRNHEQIFHQNNSGICIKSEQGMSYSGKSEPVSTNLAPSVFSDTPERDSFISAKRSDSPQKKSPNLKVCALCKQKFLTVLLLHNHIQTAHSRKSDPVAPKSDVLGKKSDPVVIKSSAQVLDPSPKNKEENIGDRSSLSRQCRKPLPPLKRRRIKKEPLEQLAKRPKL